MSQNGQKIPVALDFDGVCVPMNEGYLIQSLEELGVRIDRKLYDATADLLLATGLSQEALDAVCVQRKPDKHLLMPVPGAHDILIKHSMRVAFHLITGREEPLFMVAREFLEEYYHGVRFDSYCGECYLAKAKPVMDCGARLMVEDSKQEALNIVAHAKEVRVFLFPRFNGRKHERLGHPRIIESHLCADAHLATNMVEVAVALRWAWEEFDRFLCRWTKEHSHG